MPMFGADVAALRELARALRREQHETDATRRRLAGVVGGLPWSGDDHDHFVDEWRRVHEPALLTVTNELGDAADRARHHADRQEHASLAR